MQEGAKLEPNEEIGSAKYPRPCGAPPKWGSSTPTWDGESGDWVDDEGNHRPKDQREQDKKAKRRSTTAEKERNREMERARKRRLKEEKVKEEERRRVKHELEAPAGGAEGLQGAPPGAAAQKEHTKQKLERKNGYDTNNDLNKLLTQCLSYPITDRKKPTIITAVIKQITYLEVHCDMGNYGNAQVDGVSVVGALQLVLKELKDKDLKVSQTPPAASRPALLSLLFDAPGQPCDVCAVCWWQELRLSYSDDFKMQLKDVLLSPVGRSTVRAMVTQATKLGPEMDESPYKKLKTENKTLKLEKEQLWTKLQQTEELLQQERQQKDALMMLVVTGDLDLDELTSPHATNGAGANPFDCEFGLACMAEGPRAAADESDFFQG